MRNNAINLITKLDKENVNTLKPAKDRLKKINNNLEKSIMKKIINRQKVHKRARRTLGKLQQM